MVGAVERDLPKATLSGPTSLRCAVRFLSFSHQLCNHVEVWSVLLKSPPCYGYGVWVGGPKEVLCLPDSVALVSLRAVLVKLVTWHMNLDRPVGCAPSNLYAVDIAVIGAHNHPTEVRFAHKTRFDYKQPLIQSDDKLPVHTLDSEPDTLIFVHVILEKISNSSVELPWPH